jgi:peroxiredoxin
VHTPESEGEKVVDSIRRKAKEHGLEFPIAVDTNQQNWQAWSNSVWPSVYLIDKRGHVRYWWYGELNWQGSEGEKYLRGKIEELLAEKL